MAADGGGGVRGGEGAGRGEEAGLGAGGALALDAGFGADEACRARQPELAREAAGTFEPVELAQDGGAALLDAAVGLVEVGVGLDPVARRDEGGLDLGAQRRLVGLDREQPVGALGSDGAGDFGIGGDGVDGDERALQALVGTEPFEQRRDGGEFVRLVGHGLLGEYEPRGGGEGGDQVQRRRPGAAVVAAARGLAVDGDETGFLRPALPHPCGESGGEQRGIDAVHQDRQPAFAGNAVGVGQVPAQEIEVCGAPGGDVLVIVAVGDGAADDEQQHLGQRMQDPPHVARVLDRSEMIQQRREARLPGQGFIGDHQRRLRIKDAASIQRNSPLSPVT